MSEIVFGEQITLDSYLKSTGMLKQASKQARGLFA